MKKRSRKLPVNASGAFTGRAASRYDAWFNTPAGHYTWEAEAELLAEMLGEVNGKKLVDVGCGTGIGLALFAGLGARAVGVDPSPDMLALAAGKTGHGGLAVARGEALPFRDRTFDIACVITVLEFTDAPEKILREAGRVSRGRVVVAVINSRSAGGVIARIRERLVKGNYPRELDFNPGHLKAILERVYRGAEINLRSTLHIYPFFITPFGGVLRRVERFLSGCLAGIFLVADVRFAKD